MKVVAFNGSARKGGNTAMLINYVFEALQEEGISTELVELSGQHPHGCIACYKCFSAKDKRCAVQSDCMNECIEKMLEADGIILASPTYFADVSSEMKALIDRAGMTSRANGDMLKRKVGAAVVCRRRGGAIHVFDTMNHFFTIGQMIIVGSNYWNIGIGRDKGEVASDEEGILTMRTLGHNMAWLLKKIHR
ncbi:MAG: flavodoxin family protein [Desulfobulbaceae bacterium]|nr:flavodoxin family protein [Desulfobulbaceae bacterium]